jgi:hypothetical protein
MPTLIEYHCTGLYTEISPWGANLGYEKKRGGGSSMYGRENQGESQFDNIYYV